MNRKILKYFVSTLIVSLTIILSSNPVKVSAENVIRTSGVDRYDTAVQIALKNWKTSDNVVLVSGEGFADAVSAATLAKNLNAPILLTKAAELDPNVSEALTSLGAKQVYVIGGNASISQVVRDKLKSKYKLIELSGKDRYETNLAVAKELIKIGVNPEDVLMVSGEGFSDALTVAPIASIKGQILLLSNNDMNSMKTVINFLKEYKSKVTVIGTKHVINDEVYNLVNGISRIDGGADRFDTNLNVLSRFNTILNFDKVYIVNASNDGFADALVASVVAGKNGAPLVLFGSQGMSGTIDAENYVLKNIHKKSELNFIGGTGVINENTINGMRRRLPN